MIRDLSVSYKSALSGEIMFWVSSTIFLLLDSLPTSTAVGKWLHQHKIQGDRALITSKERWDIFKMALMNMGPCTIFCVEGEKALRRALPIEQLTEEDEWILSREVPKFLQCVIFLLTFFYWTHRLLHIPYLYKTVHKVHHQFKAPCAMGAVYAHPIEFIFGNVAGVALGPVLFKAHPYTTYFWYAFALNTTCRHHSGYDFFDAQEHDAHHEKFNFNYGVFLDEIFGTKLPKDKHP